MSPVFLILFLSLKFLSLSADLIAFHVHHVSGRGAVMLLVVSGHAHRLNRHMSGMILSRVQVPSTSRPTKSQRGPVIIQMTLGRRDKGSN